MNTAINNLLARWREQAAEWDRQYRDVITECADELEAALQSLALSGAGEVEAVAWFTADADGNPVSASPKWKRADAESIGEAHTRILGGAATVHPLFTHPVAPGAGDAGSAVEAVTRAILFADCGNDTDWQDNTELGQAAIRAIGNVPTGYDDTDPVMAALYSLQEDAHATDYQRQIARMAHKEIAALRSAATRLPGGGEAGLAGRIVGRIEVLANYLDTAKDDADWPSVTRVAEKLRAIRSLAAAPTPPASAWQHPDEIAVDRFAAAMKAKLSAKRAEGYFGWDDPLECPAGRLREKLARHMSKGDPVDVGNFAMMLFNRGEATAPPASAALTERELARRFHEAYERLAPSFGYETRYETRTFDAESANGRLMIAVCKEIMK